MLCEGILILIVLFDFIVYPLIFVSEVLAVPLWVTECLLEGWSLETYEFFIEILWELENSPCFFVMFIVAYLLTILVSGTDILLAYCLLLLLLTLWACWKSLNICSYNLALSYFFLKYYEILFRYYSTNFSLFSFIFMFDY